VTNNAKGAFCIFGGCFLLAGLDMVIAVSIGSFILLAVGIFHLIAAAVGDE
jgi:hypothetical protein